ncbi:MAG: T9SS type B sorting domain-containing protein [Bacteroidetes bacterium]|nr:T9SS type B sorting domain-containing protein [Bacteroidota bacterium]
MSSLSNIRILFSSLLFLGLMAFAEWSFAQISFESIPGLPFIDSESYFRGVTWMDVDSDGDLDVCVSGTTGTFPDFENATAIYINDGAGNFSNTGLINSDQSNTMGHGWADYDNDGDPDLYIGATWNQGGINELWENQGGSFVLNSGTGATPNVAAPYEGNVAWADYDKDGFADLFIPRWNDQSDRLYHNNGDGTFTALSGQDPVTDGAWTSAGIWGDYNNDGFPDLYVINYQFELDGPGVNRLYRNNGDGTFEQITDAGDIVTDGQGSRSANWIDANNDGWLDVFVANQGNPSTNSDGLDKLYLNNGDGTFSTQVVGTDQTSWTSQWGDYDNDGDLDLITISLWGNDARFWENDGDANFTDVTDALTNVFPLATSGSWSNVAIFVDYDEDGWLDLHIAQPDASPDFLFRNQGLDCVSWLEVKLEGQSSNRSAIGAKLFAKADVNGQALWQMREVSAQTSKPGQNPLRQHFGLGDVSVVDSLIVAWPSGDTCYFTNLPAAQILKIKEDCSTEELVAPPALSGTFDMLNLCGNGDPVQLDPPSGPGGIWSADCGDCIDQDGQFQTAGLPSGEYQVLYSQGGICGSLDTISVSLASANAGTNGALVLCDNAGLTDAFESLGGNPEPGGVWVDAAGNSVDIPVDAAELPEELYYIQGAGDCVDTSLVMVSLLQSAEPFSDTVYVVPGEEAFLDAGPGQSFTWTPDDDLSCADCPDPTFSGSENTSYEIAIEDASGCLVINTVEVIVEINTEYAFPTAFSPNGDGLNDLFRVVAEENVFLEYQLQVYSRWGKRVFVTSNPDSGWDGLVDGEPQPEDVYAWYLVYTLADGSSGVVEGEVSLLR